MDGRVAVCSFRDDSTPGTLANGVYSHDLGAPSVTEGAPIFAANDVVTHRGSFRGGVCLVKG